MRYRVFSLGRVLGPMEVREALEVRGFSRRTVVCPENRDGSYADDWRPAWKVPEFLEVLEPGRALAAGPAEPGAWMRSAPPAEGSAVLPGIPVAPAPGMGPAVPPRLSPAEAEGPPTGIPLLGTDAPRPGVVPSEAAPPEGARSEPDLVLRIPTAGAQTPPGGIPGLSPAGIPELPPGAGREPPGEALEERESLSESVFSPMPERLPETVPAAVPEAAPPRLVPAAKDVKLAASVGDLVKWVVIVTSVAVSLRYLLWRGMETLNYASPVHSVISLTLLAAEIYGFLSFLLFFTQTHNQRREPPAQAEGFELPTVDMFVPIYNEPADILYQTLVGCAAMDYPTGKRTIYVLDDGPREEVRATAAKFGARYAAREDHSHAKAGNINFGLTQSKGDLVLILDCDHIPVRSFLKETVGYFEDPKVAFVQAPHHFYNPDCYQRNLILEEELVHEQDLFFQVIEPGRNAVNATLFAGSSAVLRRSALEAIGGMKVESAIEDLHTSMTLHSRGLRGIYYDRIISGGLSPESFLGYLTQRKRWCRGGVQLFVLDNPLLKAGLTVWQRLNYFASILYFFHAWPRFVYLVTPLSFLLFEYNPIVASPLVLLFYFLPHYLLAQLTFNIIAKEHRHAFWSDVYEAASCFSLSWTILETILRPDRLVFKVTPKGREAQFSGSNERLQWRDVLPHLVLMGLLLAGVIVASLKFATGGVGVDAYLISCVWSAFNVILLGAAVEVARERPQLRSAHRIRRKVPCEVVYGNERLRGTTRDLSETGGSADLERQEHLPKVVRLFLFSDYGEVTELDAEVVRNDWREGGGSEVGLRFVRVTPPLRRSIIRQLFSSPNTWEAVRRPYSAPLKAFVSIASSVMRTRLRGRGGRKRRSWPRVNWKLPCELEAEGRRIEAATEDISATGASIAVAKDARLPRTVLIRLKRQDGGELEVEALTMRLLRSDERRAVYGFRFVKPDHIELGLLAEFKPPG